MVVGLILVALVPNLTLAAVFWLGLINPPWSKPAQPPQPATQAATVPAVLTAPAMLEATAGEEVSFPIALDGTDGVPARSVIAISGLPQGSSFSDGRPYGDTEWNLKPDQIGDLHLVLPKTVSGEIKLAIRLITPDDKVITDAGTVLKVAPAPIEQPVAAGRNDAAATLGPAPDSNEGDGAVDEKPAPVEATVAPPEESASPAEKSEQAETTPTENDAASAEWVQPSAYVNLRDGPSSSSRIVGVIAKGAKVPVLERKRGWLQVTNPTTSEKGWIYSGYVDGGRKARPRTKRAAPAEPEQKSKSSFWGWLSQ